MGGGAGSWLSIPHLLNNSRASHHRTSILSWPEERRMLSKITYLLLTYGVALTVWNVPGARCNPILGLGRTGGDGGTPNDPNGAVGRNHFIQTINSQYRIYDKAGTLLESRSLTSLFVDSPCDGSWPATVPNPLGQPNPGVADPIVLYDQWADRWIITSMPRTGRSRTDPANQPGLGANYRAGLCIAVSRTPDPTGGRSSYFTHFIQVILL